MQDKMSTLNTCSMRFGGFQVKVSKCLYVILLFFVFVNKATAAENPAQKYLLGPGDRLSIRVYDLRKNAGEAYPWTALNGEFSVGADGFVSMPILGEVKAADGTTANLAAAIGNTLKQKADLAELPAASVEVIRYRPFYVIGAVQQPGKYEFQPGMTILQAISTAQGIVRESDLYNKKRGVLDSGGELESLRAERISSEAKLSRLSAEVSEASSIQMTDYLTAIATDPHVVKAMRDETLLFNTRKEARLSEINAIEQSRQIYKQELVSLKAKSGTLERQLEISRKELAQINDLMTKGLSINSRQLAAEQVQASFESSGLDIQLATLRTQQNLSRTDRDVIELKSRFRKEALDESVVTRSKIDLNEIKQRTSSNLLEIALDHSPGYNSTEDKLVLELTHISEKGPETRFANEDEQIAPGDVLRVSQELTARQQNNILSKKQKNKILLI
ncbi:polysaccharide biosynthesis/export family protein [Methylobacterium mesophilicum]